MPIPRTVEGDGFRLTFSWHGDYLRAQVDGQHDNFEVSFDYWSRIAEEYKRLGAVRLLVVENLQEAGSVDLVVMVDAIVALGFRDVRVAFVDLIDAHLPAMEHGEILAREREITGRVFSDEQDAVRWLRHGIA